VQLLAHVARRCTNGARPRAYVRSRMAREGQRGRGLPEGAAPSSPMSVSQLEIAYRTETPSPYFTFSLETALTLPPSRRHSRVSLAAFRLHSFPRLFRPRTSRPDHVLSRGGGGRGGERSCILQINLLCRHSEQPALVPRADYKFKCKPARSRGAKVRSAPSRARGWRGGCPGLQISRR